MEYENINSFVKMALEKYDDMLNNYIDLILDKKPEIDFTNFEITFKSKERIYSNNFEYLGYFDNQANIWVWGWLLTGHSSDAIKISKSLLNYGLELEPESNALEHFLIKGLLLNSRILINEEQQLDINLAIYYYLTKNKIKFIYPHIIYLDEAKKKYVTYYFLVK